MKFLSQLTAFFKDVLDFQSRIWVVSIMDGHKKGDTYMVSEDSFKQPLQWMVNKGFDQEMLQRVEKMKLSQTSDFQLEQSLFRLLRVK